MEARATVVYEEVDKVKTVFKEAKKVNSRIEVAIRAFDNLKEKVADEDSNDQRKLYHQRLLRIIEDAGVVSGASMDFVEKFNNTKYEMFEVVGYDEGLNTSVQSAGAGIPAQFNSSIISHESKPRFYEKLLPSFSGDIKNWAAFRDRFKEVVENFKLSELEAMGWLCSDVVMKDRSISEFLLNMDYADAMDHLEERYNSRILQTKRNLECLFIETGKKVNYGPELVKMEMELKGAVIYMEKLENPIEHLTVQFLIKLAKHFPDKCRLEMEREIAAMKEPDYKKLLEIVSIHAKMEPSKTDVPVVKRVANVVQQQGGGKNKKKYDQGNNDHVKKCAFCQQPGHRTSACEKWTGMSAEHRLKHCTSKQICTICLSPKHVRKNHVGNSYPCSREGCEEIHHPGLHDALANHSSAMAVIHQKNLVSCLGLQLLSIHNIEAVVMHDTGANTNLVTEDFVRRTGVTINRMTSQLDIVGSSLQSNRGCTLLMVDVEGNEFYINAVVVDQINQATSALAPQLCAKEFGMKSQDFDEIYDRQIDLLLGTSTLDLVPKEVRRTKNAILYRSRFGRTYFTIGTSVGKSPQQSVQIVVNQIRYRIVEDFMKSEQLGIVAAKRCSKCAGCKDCSYRNAMMTWQDQKELTLIEEGLTFVPEKKMWMCTYPLLYNPEDLPNNRNMCLAISHKLLLKLEDMGLLKKFNDEFTDAVARGVYIKVTKEDENYKGVKYYTPLTFALKKKKGEMHVRICMNASMKCKGMSFNDLIPKGPASLTNQHHLLINFRFYPVICVLDVAKYYNSVVSCERDKSLRRVVWAFNAGQEPEEYLSGTLNFGEVTAGCASAVCINKTAEMFSETKPVASKKLTNDKYVDDVLTGADTMVEAMELEKDMRYICAEGGFTLKPPIYSGDDKPPFNVLGVRLDPKADVLQVCCKVNISTKLRGIRLLDDLDLDKLELQLPEALTSRQILSIIMSQYDPLGLICVIVIQLKLIMKSISGGKVKSHWDTPVSQEINVEFRKAVSKLQAARLITFERSVKPQNAVGDPGICIFCDGSSVASCALVYIVWKTTGVTNVRLLTGRAKVAPRQQESVVRNELSAAVMGARLYLTVTTAVNIKFGDVTFLTDSSAVLSMIKGDSGSLSTFGGNRVGEIQSLTKPEDWYWVSTDHNIADLGTRTDATAAEIDESSVYQNGPDWLRSEKSTWPIFSVVNGTIPREELSTAAKKHTVLMSVVADPMVKVSKFNSFRKATRVLAYVMQFIDKIKQNCKKKMFKARPLNMLLEYAANHLYSWHQVRERHMLSKGFFKELGASTVSVPGFNGQVPVVVMTGRTPEALKIGYDKDYLVLLVKDNPLSIMHLFDSHKPGHFGASQTLDRCRHGVWITAGLTLAKALIKSCMECRRSYGDLCTQKMAALPTTRFVPGPVFDNISLDLMGPFIIKDAVKKRVSGKTWIVVFVCHASGATAMEVMENYSTDSFLIAFRKYISMNGVPSTIVSDRGTQLVGAASKLPKWDWNQLVEDVQSENALEWTFTPTASPHFNGLAERHVGIAKRILKKTLQGSFTFAELDCIAKECVHLMNTKPYSGLPIDPAAGVPLTPQHLLGSRGRQSIPSVNIDDTVSHSKRFQFIQLNVTNFWKKYMMSVFPTKFPVRKWQDTEANIHVNDIVQVLTVNMVSRTWQLAVVTRILPGDDDLVRRVTVRIAGASKKEVEMGVHKLRLIYSPTRESCGSD